MSYLTFLSNRKLRVVLISQASSWAKIDAGVAQGSILGSMLFSIYINAWSDGLSWNFKLFADDLSLFLVTRDISASANELSSDWKIINYWAFQLKRISNIDHRQAPKFITKKSVDHYLQSLYQISFRLWLLFVWPSVYNFFHEKLKSAQYNAWLAVAGAIGRTSKEKFSQMLGLESL